MPQLIELTYISQPAQAISFLGLIRLLYCTYINNQAIDDQVFVVARQLIVKRNHESPCYFDSRPKFQLVTGIPTLSL